MCFYCLQARGALANMLSKMKLALVVFLAAVTAALAWWWASYPVVTSAVSHDQIPGAARRPSAKTAKQTGDSDSKSKPTTASTLTLGMPPTAPSVKAAGAPETTAALIAQAKAALEIGQPTERMAAFQRLLGQTTDAAGLNSILEAFQVLFRDGRRFDPEWQAFWHGLARRDVQGTLALIASHGPDTSWNATALSMTLNEWSGYDPSAAIHWLAAHESSMSEGSLDAATAGLIAGYADGHLGEATQYALSVVKPDDPLSERVISALAQRALQQGGTEGMIDWFNGLTNHDQRKRMFRAVAEKLGSVTFDAKIAWLTAQSQSGFRDDASYRDAASQIAKTDPRAGMDFVMQVGRSPKDGGFPGIGAASFEWLLQNPRDFTNWFQDLPSGDVRENVLRALNNSLNNDVKLDSDKRQRAVEFMQAVGR